MTLPELKRSIEKQMEILKDDMDFETKYNI